MRSGAKIKGTPKAWGYSYVIEGRPATITHHGRDVLCLDPSQPSQYRQVLRVLRVLNASVKKGA